MVFTLLVLFSTRKGGSQLLQHTSVSWRTRQNTAAGLHSSTFCCSRYRWNLYLETTNYPSDKEAVGEDHTFRSSEGLFLPFHWHSSWYLLSPAGTDLRLTYFFTNKASVQVQIKRRTFNNELLLSFCLCECCEKFPFHFGCRQFLLCE